MKQEGDSKYNRRYHLQRELKPVLDIHSHKGIIYMPDGIQLCETDQRRVDALVNEYGYTIVCVIPVEKYETVLINGSRGIKGAGLQFRKEMFCGVKKGEQVLQVGKGKETGANSVDKFSKPATYAGTIYIETTKHYAVRLNAELYPGSEAAYYLLYRATAKDIYRAVYKDGRFSHNRIFKPEIKARKQPKKQKPAKQEEIKFDN